MLNPSMLGHPITAEVRSLSKWPGRPVKSPSDRDEGWCISLLGRIVVARQACYNFDSRFAAGSMPEAEEFNQYRRRAEHW